MTLARKLFVSVALAGLLLGGCTSQVTEREQYSGFLSNYNNLEEVTTTSGEKALRWVNPAWNPNAYDTIAFRTLEFYPAPKPNEQVNRQTLAELQDFMSRKAKLALGQKYQRVSNVAAAPAGSRPLILRAAITGVSASNEGMKWYEIMPIAAVVGATQAATGHRDQDTNLFIEAEFIDGRTHQTMAKVVRKVFGSQLENESQKITTKDFKAAIEKLSVDLKTFIQR
ncbi:DUF3313 domain-containing protein [Pseudomonas vancouverensis]|uniref:DUF3313 domain-containing protein n=1 Tax=Pseudomonas vancouverensis TaxID=95300 RepID=A0A1H2NMT2_PSEVA|nr:DUF3313 domain-containing protein [Pseudomonas vancouverensis]KAB0495322.1 DUF3313 domain-containing protein [Pseudomonas vancouverensis]TDB62396.1 DUF3313 domain-containing protein [Pseudomonas vancouverensis]SDV06762.1 Protein of unknown function [Pseudomonas vancouverensis]